MTADSPRTESRPQVSRRAILASTSGLALAGLSASPARASSDQASSDQASSDQASSARASSGANPASGNLAADPAAGPGSDYRLVLDPGTVHQTIDGFGASGAWWSQNLGTWSDRRRNQVADLLFSTGRGIGLSQYRYNFGGGHDDTITDPWRTGEGFEVAPGRYDFSRDAAARWFLRAAKARGVSDFIAFVNSPPRSLTANGHTYGTPGISNLPAANYPAFTQYLIDLVRHFRDVEGINFTTISPINEPQWGWDAPGQEGCHYEPDEVLAATLAVVQGFADSGLPTHVSAPEAGEYKSLYSDQSYASLLLNDRQLRAQLGDLATHSYWSNDDQRIAAAELMKNYPDVKLAMTEWCEMVGGRDPGMDSALVLARTVHSDLTLANATCWQYWIAVSRYDYHDGLLYTDYVRPGDAESIIETQRLWALGNYSKFIRPGARRMGLEVQPLSQVPGSQARIPFVQPAIATGATIGQSIFRVEDPAGDDNGPGSYTYPTNSVFVPGCFDLLSVEAIDDGADVLFRLQLGADFVDPWNGSPVGYDLQTFDIYFDTGAEPGFTDLLPGRRAVVADGYSWNKAIWATGRTDAAAANVAEKVSPEMQAALFVAGDDAQSVEADVLTIRVPKSFLGEIGSDWAVQVLVMGAEGSMEADSLRAREVKKDQSDWNFGGGSDGGDDSNIIDLLVPEGMTQAQALAFTEGTQIEVFASAYRNSDGAVVVVAINEGEVEQSVELALPTTRGTVALTPHRTAEGEALAKGSVVKLRRGSGGMARGSVTLAARSITTYVAAGI